MLQQVASGAVVSGLAKEILARYPVWRLGDQSLPGIVKTLCVSEKDRPTGYQTVGSARAEPTLMVVTAGRSQPSSKLYRTRPTPRKRHSPTASRRDIIDGMDEQKPIQGGVWFACVVVLSPLLALLFAAWVEVMVDVPAFVAFGVSSAGACVVWATVRCLNRRREKRPPDAP